MAVDPKSAEEQRLAAAYHVATEKYTAAVGDLSRQRATIKREEYNKLLKIVESARQDCERIHAALVKLRGWKKPATQL